MILVEFQKQIARLRTYLALGLLVVIPVVFTLAFKFGGGPHDREERGFLNLATHSGLNMPLAALSVMMSFLLPVVVAIFAGSAIAEEASWGTLRYLLLRPISRSHVLASKVTIVAAMTLLATVLIVLAGTLGGVAAFGWHPVITPSGAVFTPSAALGRLGLATLYVAWSMSALVAIAFLVSTVTDGAVAAGVGVAIVSQILDAIPPMRNIRSALPTHYWHAWESLYSNSVSVDHIVRGIFLQVPYVIACLAFAWWWFHRKDIVT